MNAYDFDKTIFYPDSSAEFYKFCLRKYPLAVGKTLPKTAAKALCYAVGLADAKELKEQLFSFLCKIKNIDEAVSEFWRKNEHRIGAWYTERKKADDLIISASPEFLLEPICKKLGVSFIGTRMDKYSGKITGKNCHDTEKVIRFTSEYPDTRPEEFYSDSKTDSPMAEWAQKSFLVKKHEISPWRY